ncbi:SDR family NAD(P)-dependent oxidoreductase [Croceicoccus sp. F390]|uniref:SDR family NAD(P)-dependent oxidoreductase n=1 Tax=Croceicoccus esteveae TaxID=3075597 RepID=A0ABU2ZIT1_9SPHN|nr:SDR family NAD(P)-dependent oxidoreductase [Croceicoccus sp. F390]MDT0576300.1 SDR family NAD(P)-dependent oxidoreductase [Croceicoccus sp. F390]
MKTAVITGASSGIGLVVARELARDGWRVIAQGRNPERAEAALAEIRSNAPNAKVDMLLADLSVMKNVSDFAAETGRLITKIDVLVNNAGFTPVEHVETVDGLEQCFATNHLAAFLLTKRLLPLLKAAAPGSQVINTASVAHKFIKDMKWDDLQQVRKFSESDAYTQSKLANILHVRALARRIEADGVRANAVHPGLVRTNFDAESGIKVKLLYIFGRPFSITPKQGADTILWLARGGTPEANGQYFVKRKPGILTRAARSHEGAERLWQISEDLVAKAGQ